MNPYAIPWQPLSLDGLSGVVDAYQKASLNRDANARAEKDLALRERTLSADEYRKTEAFKVAEEERKRKHDVEKIAAYDPAVRMAERSPELATSLYKSPFGFSFSKAYDLAPGHEGPEMSPAREAARFDGHPLGPMGAAAASINGIQDASDPNSVDAVSGGLPPVEPAPQSNVPPIYVDPAAPPKNVIKIDEPIGIRADPMPEPKQRLYADVGGGFNEVPARPESPTGLGAKYDAIYNTMLDQAGATPRQAFDKVLADYEKDQAIAGSDARLSRTIAQGNSNREDTQTFNREQSQQYNLTAEQKLRLEREKIAAMKAANADKKTDKEDLTAVRAGEGDSSGLPAGSVIGRVPTGKGGAQGFATRDADYTRAEHTLMAAIADVEANGERVVSPDAVKRRNTLYNNAIIGVATVSPLGKTNEAQKLESESIGASGAPSLEHPSGVFVGANLSALKRKLEEIRHQRKLYRDQTLIPNKAIPAPRSAGHLDEIRALVDQLETE